MGKTEIAVSVSIRIAREVMGWEVSKLGTRFMGNNQLPYNEAYTLIPDFERSLDACAIAEQRIEEMGLMDAYRKAFHEMAMREFSSEILSVPSWFTHFLIRLTPAQRCAAMLKAVEK